ncbi:DNA polymerase/3'-5' exonuclease PolX [Flavihumibacter solisilvae]|nr:DNA polymerase/3'-5' exonuclease PolX [Flavihumibacter solisilvae]
MMDNYAIADQFSLLSRLMDIHGDNPFKSKSYSSAAFNIEKLPVQLADTPAEKISSLKGIGDSSARKIIELIETGKMTVLEDLIIKTPSGILEMMALKGLGPKKIATIWKEMGIESMGELLYACNENRLLMYKGFGEKTQESVKQSINFYLHNKGYFLYAETEDFAHEFENVLKQYFTGEEVSLAGDVLRQSNIITQLELITTIPQASLYAFLQAQNFNPEQPDEKFITAIGATGIRIIIHFTSKEKFIAARFASSCSELFLDEFISATGYDAGTTFTSEADLFAACGIHPIPVNQRELPETVRKALNGPLPTPIEVSDIKGIIHTHSNWSDGLHTIEVMAKACIAHGYEYLVISDHSRSAAYANGLSADRIREQHAYVDELNAKYAPFRIFKSIECDILGDGSLDYPDEILASFDLVIASVHSNLKMTEEKAMQRLLKAIQHPATTILGHMTGRLLLSRPGYPIDHKMIIDACVDHNVVIEINAHPRRLDLDWSWIPYALEKGCLLSIDPDAHQVEAFSDVKYGVISSQKGGLTKERNLSSFSLEQFVEFLSKSK